MTIGIALMQKGEPMNDLISRAEAIELKPEFLNPNVNRETKEQTAIDRAYARGWNSCNTHWIKEIIEDLPSAQPERLTDYSFEESCTDCPAYDTENHRCPRFNQVIRRALKDANLEPCEDCISRQAAIDALDVLCQEHRYKIPGKIETYSQYNEAWQDALDRAEGAIFNLPSAQPEKRTEKRTETHACDLIDREAAVDAIYHHLPSVSRTRARTMLHEVPPAQPDQDREFIKLTVRNSNGRPYYSIIYLEVDDNGVGRDFEGYSSYSLDVISDYLKKYFMPSALPETCEGCKHLGKWENEFEYGYPSPCTRCKRRVEDHYER